jgi:hypothetical protein
MVTLPVNEKCRPRRVVINLQAGPDFDLRDDLGSSLTGFGFGSATTNYDTLVSTTDDFVRVVTDSSVFEDTNPGR